MVKKCIPTEKVSLILRDRSNFTKVAKDDAWQKAKKVHGKNADRWRRDIVGNVVLKEHNNKMNEMTAFNYDHIIPRSKGGKSDASNCQILQAALNKRM